VRALAEGYTFNPGFMSDAESIATFLVRLSELQRILAAFEGQGFEQSERFILLGPRGAGKTTMCRRVLAEVRTSLFLRERWEPIFLSEESYTVTTPGELLLECLFQLAQQPHGQAAQDCYEEARAIADEIKLHAHCLAFFRRQVTATAKRFMIIVENLHMIMRDQLSGDPEELVAIISDQSLFGVLATAVEQTSDEDAETLPYGFTVIALRPLTLEECQTLWKGLTGLEADKTRIRPLQILTGGSPRLIHILAEFMQTPSLSDLMGNLNRLIDQNTEYFKNQLDLLPSGERKVFVTLLEAWDPSSAKQVAEGARVLINLASAALNRLSERGMVEKSRGSGRAILYHASERLFNIYYLMRRRTHPSDRVRALVTFMTQYYDQKELVDTTTKLAFEACRIEPSQRGDHHSLFDAISKGLPEAARAEMLRRAPPDFLKSLERDAFVQRYSPPKDAAAHGARSRSEYDGALESARAALSEGNFAEAASHATRARSLRPRAIQPWILHALINLFSADYEGAIAAATTAVEMKPGDMAAHSILGTALAAAGRDAEAEIALERSIELNPQAMRAIIELGKLREKRDRLDEAADLYQRASEISPLSDPDIAQFGRLLLRLKQFDRAEHVLRAAIAQIDDPYCARRALAELLHRQGRDDEAADILRQSALAADDWERWADFASFLIDVKADDAAAKATIEQAFAKDISSPILFWLLARAMQRGAANDDAIAEVARRCLRTHVGEPTSWIVAGQIFELIDQDEDAEAIYRDAIASDQDDNGQAWLLLGRILAQTPRRATDAEEALRRAIEKGQGEQCGPLKELAELLVHRGDDPRADRLVADALSINDRCYCSLLLKGEIAIRNDDLPAARQLLKRAIEIEPHGITAMTALARISSGDEAVELIEAAHGVAPGHPRVLLARGRLAERSLAERMEDVREAIEVAPDLAEAKLELAVLYSRHGVEEQVALLLSDVLSTVPERMELIPLFVESAISIANCGMAEVIEQVLAEPAGASLEPLLIALKMRRGETPVVAKEVNDVALDILEQMQRNTACHPPRDGG
jgi:tetratricopeptide (TPR) repeat protein/DNA-binding transcriptional regulator YhcF (GntR family)